MTKPIDLKDFYENEALCAERYSTKHFWESRYHNKRMEILQTLLTSSFAKCKTFLDIGCGTGEYLSFGGQFVNYVCGLDISKSYLHRCKFSKSTDLILGDLANLPFQNQAFDCVLCSEVIEHIKPHEIAIHEILRVSRNSVIVSTPNHGALRILMGRIRKQKITSTDAKVGHVNILRFSEILPKFKSRGWRISIAFTKNIFPPILDEIHFPKAAAPLIDLLECVMNNLAPAKGSITVIKLESNNILNNT